LVLRNLDLTDEVYDIEWSPYCSTLFASTAKDGRLELWDLHKRQLDPIFVDWDGSTKKESDMPSRTCVKFNPYDPVLASGNTDGDINIYRIFGYEGEINFLKHIF
jgi:dynein intermediate chain 4, axonemal